MSEGIEQDDKPSSAVILSIHATQETQLSRGEAARCFVSLSFKVIRIYAVNPLIRTATSNEVGRLAVDEYVGNCIWYSEKGTGRGRSPPRPILAVPNVTAHSSAASLPIWFSTLCM